MSEEETTTLKFGASFGTTQHCTALGEQVVLCTAQGMPLQEIFKRTGVSVNNCLKWRKRFADELLEGLGDKPGRGYPQTITQEQRLEVMALACTTPIDGSTRWSTRQPTDHT